MGNLVYLIWEGWGFPTDIERDPIAIFFMKMTIFPINIYRDPLVLSFFFNEKKDFPVIHGKIPLGSDSMRR